MVGGTGGGRTGQSGVSGAPNCSNLVSAPFQGVSGDKEREAGKGAIGR